MNDQSGIYWLASYPKSGNTWFRAFIANLQRGHGAEVDINALDTGEIASSRAWLDELLGFDSADLQAEEIEQLRPEIYRWTVAKEAKGLGYHKIHDAYLYLKNGEPMVSRDATRGALYILRNPLDVAISAANHWGCTIDDAIHRMNLNNFEIARNKRGMHLQVGQRLLSWSQHVLSWIDADGLNCHVIRYEDMLNDGLNSFTEASRFLELDTDEALISKAMAQSSFEKLAAQEQARGFRERSVKAERFFRNGKAGSWRETLTSKQVDKIIENHAEVMQRFGYIDIHGSPYLPGSDSV